MDRPASGSRSPRHGRSGPRRAGPPWSGSGAPARAGWSRRAGRSPSPCPRGTPTRRRPRPRAPRPRSRRTPPPTPCTDPARPTPPGTGRGGPRARTRTRAAPRRARRPARGECPVRRRPRPGPGAGRPPLGGSATGRHLLRPARRPEHVRPAPRPIAPVGISLAVCPPQPPFPGPEDLDGWRVLASALDAGAATMPDALTGALRASVEDVTIAGVACFVAQPREVRPGGERAVCLEIHRPPSTTASRSTGLCWSPPRPGTWWSAGRPRAATRPPRPSSAPATRGCRCPRGRC